MCGNHDVVIFLNDCLRRVPHASFIIVGASEDLLCILKRFDVSAE